MVRASAVLAGAGTVLTWAVTSLSGSLAGRMALCGGARACPGDVSPGAVRQKDLSLFSSKLTRPYRHFPGTTRARVRASRLLSGCRSPARTVVDEFRSSRAEM